MTQTQSSGAARGDLRPRFSQQQLSAAASKMISATIGDIAVVFSRSPAHKHYSLADIEWMILPAVLTGQVYVVEAEDKTTGAKAPIAVVLWASVSAETDQRLSANLNQKIRLRPEEWASGDNFWIVDVAGNPQAVVASLKTLLDGPLKGRNVKVMSADAQGAPRIEMLRDLAERAQLGAA